MDMNQMREAHVPHWLFFWVPSNPFQGNLMAALHISRETQEHHLLLEVTLGAVSSRIGAGNNYKGISWCFLQHLDREGPWESGIYIAQAEEKL